MKNITFIPATRDSFSEQPKTEIKKLKVAGYARVSTDNEEQINSYEAQRAYFEEKIRRNPEWEFAGIYADEGISGTSIKRREGFSAMIEAAENGEIDRILTKSVSRFARNTVDLLRVIRSLTAHGVSVFFEKENLDTSDGKSELLITIMSSLAQEESRSISDNVTWGKRKSFADGNVSMAYKNFLGYDKGEDGRPVINEEQAKTVRLIFRLFMEGKTAKGIAKELDKLGIETPTGKKGWNPSTIMSMLQNEKYKGDALLQKTYVADFLTKTIKKNDGVVPQYYITGSHQYIIEPDEWDMVQLELERRRKLGSAYSGTSIFSSRIVCGDCGSFFGIKVWHSNDKFRKQILRCNKEYANDKKCRTGHIDIDAFKIAFLTAYNELMVERDDLIEACDSMRHFLAEQDNTADEIERINLEIELINGKVKTLIQKNATELQSQQEYFSKYSEFEKEHQRLVDRLDELLKEQGRKKRQDTDIRLFISALKKSPEVISEWDDKLWINTIEKAVVNSDGTITFEFKCGKEINVKIV